MLVLAVQRWEVSCNLHANSDWWRLTAWIALLRMILRASLNFVRRSVAINEVMSVTGAEESTGTACRVCVDAIPGTLKRALDVESRPWPIILERHKNFVSHKCPTIRNNAKDRKIGICVWNLQIVTCVPMCYFFFIVVNIIDYFNKFLSA